MSTTLAAPCAPAPATTRARSTPYLLATGVVAAAWLLMYLVRPVPRFPLDDPYITLHSAQALHWGFDPNYPGVSPLYGETSAPFLGLVYLLLFFLAPLRALDIACWLGILAYLLGLVYLTRSLKLSRLTALAIVVLGVTLSFIPFHLLNGLETTWAMAGVIWTMSLGTARRFRAASFVAGVTATIRPDLLPFAVCIVLAFTWMQSKNQRWGSIQCTLPLLLLPIALCACWYLSQTGHPFPLTGVAKHYYWGVGSPLDPRRVGLATALAVIYLLSCGPAVLSFKRISRHPIAVAVVASAAFGVLATYLQLSVAIAANRFRYPVVFTPMLVWGLALLAAQRPSKRLLLISLGYSLLITVPFSVSDYLFDCSYYDTALRESADWCNQNLPADARILVQDAGYISYATRFRIVDFVGLKTPEAIELNHKYTLPSAGRYRVDAVAALAIQEKAGYLINLEERSVTKELPAQLRAKGWRVDQLASRSLYHIYAIQPPKDAKQ